MSALTELADRAELTDLVTRLNRWLDDQNVGDAREIYTENASVHSPRGKTEGLDAIMRYVRDTSDDNERTQHLATDVLVELDGDRADVTANLLVYFYRAGESAHRTVGLHYTFDATRTANGWRLARTEIAMRWRQSNAEPAETGN